MTPPLQGEEEGEDEYDDEDDDEEEELDFERKARHTAAKLEREAHENEDELQRKLALEGEFRLPSVRELEEESQARVALQTLTPSCHTRHWSHAPFVTHPFVTPN